MQSNTKKVIKICLYVVLFCIPIICLICGIIIEKEGLVIGGTMGILLAFIISILFEFHERQVERRRNNIRILVNSEIASQRNIRIEIAPTNLTIVETIPDDVHINVCGAPKDLPSDEKVVCENI